MRKKEREVTGIGEIESIISESDVCRIAFANNNTPYLVTMNFGYTGGNEKRLYFHCANEGRKLEMLKKNSYVCFEMDTDHKLITDSVACECSMKYSIVVGYGHISIVEGRGEKIEGFNIIMSHYAPGRKFDYNEKSLEKTTVLRLDILELAGKRS